MQIRESTDSDADFILKVHLEAFGESEGEAVSQLVLELLKDETVLPILSLIAERNNEPVGHIVFSSVKVGGVKPEGGYILSPLAVTKNNQGGGVGTHLINEGLRILKERGAKFVLVLGDPKYYSRTGFNAGYKIKPPHNLAYPEAWMAQELIEGVLKNIAGTAQCAASLNSPKYW